MDEFEADDGAWTPSRLGWLSPRISFSQDIALFDSLKISPEKRKREEGEDQDSASEFEFAQSGRMDVRHVEEEEEGMLSADELFAEGKLRPLVRWRGEQQEGLETTVGRSFNENPRCSSMAIENSRKIPARSCVSLNNSRCSSPTRGAPPKSSAPPPPTSKNSNRFKDFFKLKKRIGKEVPSIGKEIPSIGKESVSSSSSISAAASCKSPRSFWPFSRSNSAGESKISPAISPPPRRSNSAGESKTSSSSLLPSSRRNIPKNIASKTSPISKNSAPSQSASSIPPFPSFSQPLSHLPKNIASKTSPISKNSAPSQSASSIPPFPSFSQPLSTASVRPPDTRGTRTFVASVDSISSKLNRPLWDVDVDSNPSPRNHPTMPDSTSSTVRVKVCYSPGRPLRRVPGNPARNFARGSPGRRGVWNSPGRVNGGRGSIRMDGSTKVPKVLVRPQDTRNRESWKGSDRPITATMRISPVLNVPMYIGPSLRGSRASSKPKIFNLGKFFSKKERAYAVLPATDTQSGA